MEDGTENATETNSLEQFAREAGIPLPVHPVGKAETELPAKSGKDSKVLSEGADEISDDDADQDDAAGDGDDDEEGDAEGEGAENDGDDSEGDDDGDDSDESDDDTEKDDDDEETEETKSHGIRKLQRRNKVLTARWKSAEEQRDAVAAEKTDLEGRLAKASAIVIEPTPDNPLSKIETLGDLDRQVQLARRIEAWAEDHPDGVEVEEANGEKRFATADEIKARLRAARSVLRAEDSRRQYLNTRPDVEAEVRLFYPDLNKPGTNSHSALVALLKQVPELRRLPNVEVLVGDALVGQSMRAERYKALQKAKGAPKKDGKVQPKSAASSPTKLPSTPTVSRAQKVPGNDARKKASAARVASGDRSEDAILRFIDDVVLS